VFGSVTCLATSFHLRTPDILKPLLISNQIILDYSQNCVDTLHMKNFFALPTLHNHHLSILLGEDRYLTTLLLKHFLMYKTQFIQDANVVSDSCSR
ncbi:glycosyltransferase family 2 protein, partial [Scleroderma citrinum Foug A]